MLSKQLYGIQSLGETCLIGNNSTKVDSSTKHDSPTRGGIEQDSQNNRLIFGLESSTTNIFKGSQIGLRGKGKEEPQDKFHICWTKLPSLSTLTWTEDGKSFGGEVPGEILDSLPVVYMHTNGVYMEMDRALIVYFGQRMLCKKV